MENKATASFVNHFPKMRRAIFVLLFVAIIPILSLFIYKDARRASTVVKDTEYVVQRASTTIAAAIDAKFEETRSILAVIASGYTIRQKDHVICDEVMEKTTTILDGYALIGALDKDGNTFCLSQDYNYLHYAGDRQYFKRTMDLKSFAGGEFQISRIAKIPTLNFGYPATDEDGNIFAISAAAIDLTYFEKLSIYETLAPNAKVTLIDEGGVVMAEYPPNGMVGQTITEDKIANKVINSRNDDGVFYDTDEKGVETIIGYAKLKQEIATGNMYVYVKMPRAVLFDNAGNELYRDIVFVAAILIATFVIEVILWQKLFLPIVEECKNSTTSRE